MLARAIVDDRLGVGVGLAVLWARGPATQGSGLEADFGQPVDCHVDVARFATVRGASQGKVAIVQAEVISGSRFDEWQCLEALRCAARVDRLRRVAGVLDDSAALVDQHPGATMDGLQPTISMQLDERGVVGPHWRIVSIGQADAGPLSG